MGSMCVLVYIHAVQNKGQYVCAYIYIYAVQDKGQYVCAYIYIYILQDNGQYVYLYVLQENHIYRYCKKMGMILHSHYLALTYCLYIYIYSKKVGSMTTRMGWTPCMCACACMYVCVC